ncbi:MAG: DUF2905 domain-containing protein [Dethiobacteria bacterium]|nr:DUF2905 domain-containing protein [Bacillota bacterium]HQD51849.1 DUF2905 domain-containing protein [Bacillota bacterium]
MKGACLVTDSLGKILLAVGGLIAVAGLLLLFFDRFGLGRLPGDIIVQKENFTFYFPITTMLLVSAVLTLLFNLVGRFFK